MADRAGRILCAALALAAILPLAYSWRFPTRYASIVEGIPNPDDYVRLGCSLADHGTLSEADGQPSASREPGYPLVLGTVFRVFGKSYGNVVLLNAAMAALAVWLLFLTGRRIFGARVALAAAVIASLYPPFIYYAAQPRRETMMVLLSVFCLRELFEAAQTASPRRAAAAGAAGAAAALTNTAFLLFGLAAAPFWLVWRLRGRPAAALRQAVVYLGFLALLYAAWPLRNYRAFGSWILGSTAAGGTLFYANQVLPPGAGGTPEETRVLSADPVYLRGSSIEDRRLADRFFWKAGLERAKAEPGRFLGATARRFVDQWRLAPHPARYEHSNVLLKWVSLLSDGWIIPLGLVGMVLSRLRPAEAGGALLFIVSFNLPFALIFSMLRYRLPVMPWVILFAALALSRGWDRLRLVVPVR